MSITNYDREKARKLFVELYGRKYWTFETNPFRWGLVSEVVPYNGVVSEKNTIRILQGDYATIRGGRLLKRDSNRSNRRKTRILINTEDYDEIPNEYTRVFKGNRWQYD